MTDLELDVQYDEEQMTLNVMAIVGPDEEPETIAWPITFIVSPRLPPGQIAKWETAFDITPDQAAKLHAFLGHVLWTRPWERHD